MRLFRPTDRGEVFHRYILGVYDLYERLTSTFFHMYSLNHVPAAADVLIRAFSTMRYRAGQVMTRMP